MHPNPFALVTVAYLQARQTRNSIHRRRIAKWRLTKLLYQRDWGKQRIINLYRVIDWIMRLPQGLEARLREGILQMERRKTMTYLSSIERIGMEIGMKKGMQQGLEEGRQEGRQEGRAELLAELLARRFGELGGDVRERLATATAEQLSVWGANFVDARSLAEVFRSG